MLTVIGDRVGVRGVDDDRPIMAELFLKARVAVIPIGPRLDDRKFVDEGRSGPDPWKADARNPVPLEGQDQPLPVDRTALVAVVDDDRKGTRLTSSHPRASRKPTCVSKT